MGSEEIAGRYSVLGFRNMAEIKKTEEEWKRELTPEQYRVLREKSTEAPFTGAYYNSKEKGMYTCAACGQELFSSDAKFDSGTGWPSFSEPANTEHVELRQDTSHDMTRMEVICKRCGSHLGHVFDDGPISQEALQGSCAKATGKRFCINSCALDFKREG